MKQKQTFSDKVFQFDQELGNVKINVYLMVMFAINKVW